MRSSTMSGHYLAAVEGTVPVTTAAAVGAATAPNCGSRGRGRAEERIPSDLPVGCTRDDFSVVRLRKETRTKDVGLMPTQGSQALLMRGYIPHHEVGII